MQRTSTAALACALAALLVTGLVVWRTTGGEAPAPSPTAADPVASDAVVLPTGRAAHAHAESGVPPAPADSGWYPAAGTVVDAEGSPVAVSTLDAAPITVDLREDHDLSGIELRLSRGERVTGEVVDTAGQPVAGATVGVELLPDPSLASRGARRSPRRIANIDADGSGRFEI